MTKKRDSVYVSSTDLPWYMKEGLFIERKSRHLYQIPNETFIFTGNEGWSNHKAENENSLLFTIILIINMKNFKLVVLKRKN